MSYNKIQDNFWIDEKVRGWDFKTRMIALYLLNNQHRFSEGLYHLPLSYIVEDTKLTKKEIDKALKKLCSDNFIKYDRVNSIILIINALKYQPLQNINHCKAALKKLEQLPKSPLLKELIAKAKLYNPKFYQLLKKQSQNIKFLQVAFQEISNNDLNSTQTKGLKLDLAEGLQSEAKDSQAQTPTPVPILTQTLDKEAEIIFKDNQNPELKELEKLTCYLIELIENNNPRAPLPAKDPTNSLFKKWYKELERLHRLGPVGANADEKKGYSFQEIEAIINFSQQDQFWKNNILSARALRKQVIKLENKMRSSKYSKSNQKTDMLKNLYLAAKEEEEQNEKN